MNYILRYGKNYSAKFAKYLLTNDIMLLFSFLNFWVNYWNTEINTINDNIRDIGNIGYTYLFLAIIIKLFREGKQ